MNRWTYLVLAWGATALAGCGLDQAAEYPLSTYTRNQLFPDGKPGEAFEVPPAVQTQIRDILAENYSPPWFWEDGATGDAKTLKLGAELYQKHCIHCHGIAGGGDGPTAAFLFPRPRDYRRGVYKWKSTERADKPTHDDIMRVLHEGVNGTSMPPFALLEESERRALADYVIYLSQRGELERQLLVLFDSEAPPQDKWANADELSDVVTVLKEEAPAMVESIRESWLGAEDKVVSAPEAIPVYEYGSPESEAALERGKKLFLGEKGTCYKCHGNDGKADPNQMAEDERKRMFDDWGFVNYPRNLHLGLYRGGRRPIDLYRRIHEGVSGAQMQSFSRNLTAAEIWDLVYFVRTLPYRPSLLETPKAATEPHHH